MDGLEAEAVGEVRIAAPPGLCVDWVPRLAARLARTHPAVTLCALADIAARDLDRREADIALRLVPTTRGDLLVRRLASFRGGLVRSVRHALRRSANRVKTKEEHMNGALVRTAPMHSRTLHGPGARRLWIRLSSRDPRGATGLCVPSTSATRGLMA